MAPVAPEPDTPPPVRRRHVTTAFVQRADGAVLLVKRSGGVGTYRHQWGAVSGGLEENDDSLLCRAQQEVVEEAGLAPSQLRFVRCGRPLLVDDPPRHFAVHPFLLTLEDHTAQVTLNWENEAFAWRQPEEIRSMDAVPLLADTYERVGVSEAQAAALRTLRDDRQHGAAELARWAVRALGQEAAALAAAAKAEAASAGSGGSSGGGVKPTSGPACLAALRNFGYHLAACRPSMAAVASAVAAVLAAAHGELHARADAFEAPAQEVCQLVQAAVAAEERRLDGAAVALRGQVAAMLQDGTTLMTTSLSSTILAAVREAAAAGRGLKAIVCEARPLCEGVQLAEAWAQAGIDVTIITDAQAGLFVRQADLVLVGADAVTADAAVNKTGTYLLSLAAQAAGVPMWAVADTGKLSPGPLCTLGYPGGQQRRQSAAGEAAAESVGHEEMGPAEVIPAWGRPVPPGAKVRNVYFEDTPLHLLAGVVTESGQLDKVDIEQQLAQRLQQYRTAFQLP